MPRRVSPVVTCPGCSSEWRIIRRARRTAARRSTSRTGVHGETPAQVAGLDRPQVADARRGPSGRAAPRRPAGRGRPTAAAPPRPRPSPGPRTSGPRWPSTRSSSAVRSSSSTGMRRAYAVGPSVRRTSRTSSSRSRGSTLPGPTTCQEPSISKWVCSVSAAREAGEHVLAVGVEGRDDLPRQVGRRVLRHPEVGRHDRAAHQLLAQAPGGLPDAVTLRHASILPRQRAAHPAGDDAA